MVGHPVEVKRSMESSASAVSSVKTFDSLAGVLATPIFQVIMWEGRPDGPPSVCVMRFIDYGAGKLMQRSPKGPWL